MTVNSKALLNNRYKVVENLGRGGFGETFLAIDTHLPSQRKCVIKQLKPIINGPIIPRWMYDRFEQEARILESLGEKQGQIPQLYAYFQEEQNFYLVQEWIDGITLQAKVERDGVFSPEEVEKILLKILPTLSYIHEQDIVHRDLKPDNIIYRHGDKCPVLIDFGAVKEALTKVEYPQGKSAYSIAIGTPGYMPSEQAAGRPLYSSDLYSLALTAVYLLTGKSPQYLKNNVKTGEILWRQEIPNLHSSLASVIDRAIRFHPAERFSTAEEMLSALQEDSNSVSDTSMNDHHGNYSTSSFSQIKTKALLGNAPRKLNLSAKHVSTNQTRYVSRKNNHSNLPSPSRNNKVTNALSNQEESKFKLAFPPLLPLIMLCLMAIGSFLLGYQFLKTVNDGSQVTSSPEIIPENPLDKLPKEKPAISEPGEEEVPTPEEEKPENPESELPSEKETIDPLPPVEEKKPTSKPSEKETAPVNSPENKGTPIGLSASQLTKKWGQPSSKYLAYGDRVTILTYDSPVKDINQVKFLISNQTQQIVQVELITPPEANLKTITTELNQSVKGKMNSEARNAIKEVLIGTTDLRSFHLVNYQGMVQKRNQNLEIRVWDKNFSF